MHTSLALLRVFVTVADTGSIRPAAARLGRTVSAVSMALKQLERDVGTNLFEGERKGQLTKAGQFALEQARGILDHYERAWGTLRAFAQNKIGRIDVASVPSIAATLLPEAVRRSRQSSPNLEIEIRDMDSRAVLEAVQKSVAEVGFGTFDHPIPGLQISPLFSDNLELVCSSKDSLVRLKRPIRWKDLKNRVFLANGTCKSISTPEFKEVFSAAQLQVHNVTSLIALASAGVGVTVLPHLSKPPGDRSIRFLPVADPTAKRRVSTIVKSEQSLSPAGAIFLETVRAVVRDQAQVLGIRVEAV
jgi:DNA-binding transcriptional LysR family regulator